VSQRDIVVKVMRVVADCNVLISILIGGRLQGLREHLLGGSVVLIVSDRLLKEVRDVGDRSHLHKYFDQKKLEWFIDLVGEVAVRVKDPDTAPAISRDPDDDYLLALCKAAKVHVLLTGDKDLLVLEKHGRTRIMNARTFIKEYL
jgi:uncharacterized protein